MKLKFVLFIAAAIVFTFTSGFIHKVNSKKSQVISKKEEKKFDEPIYVGRCGACDDDYICVPVKVYTDPNNSTTVVKVVNSGTFQEYVATGTVTFGVPNSVSYLSFAISGDSYSYSGNLTYP